MSENKKCIDIGVTYILASLLTILFNPRVCLLMTKEGRIGSGRVGSGRVGSGRVGSGRVE